MGFNLLHSASFLFVYSNSTLLLSDKLIVTTLPASLQVPYYVGMVSAVYTFA